MKKLIAIVMMLLPMIAGAQTRTSVVPIKVFGIPLGITADQFTAKAEALNDSILPQLLHIKEAKIFLNMYDGYSGERIVWQAFVKANNKYVSPSNASTRIVAVLNAKYGTPHESQTCDGKKTLRWDIKGGYIQVWNEKRYGDDAETFYMQFVDYAALKKADSELYRLLQ